MKSLIIIHIIDLHNNVLLKDLIYISSWFLEKTKKNKKKN